MKNKSFFLILLIFTIMIVGGCLGDKNVKLNQPAEPKQIEINNNGSISVNTNNIVSNPTSDKYSCKVDDDCGICDCDVFEECASISWWQEKIGPDLECSCQKEQCACKSEKCVKQ